MRYLVTILICCICAQRVVAADNVVQTFNLTVKNVCNEITTSGDVTTDKFKGKLSAAVSGILKGFGNAEASGDFERERQQYTGVMQKDLPEIMKSSESCRLRIFEIFAPSLMRYLDRSEDDTIRLSLKPANSLTPPNACSGTAHPESLIVLLGNSAAQADLFPNTVLRIDDRDIITVRKHSDGALSFDAELIGEDGRSVAKVVDNRLTVNPNNFFTLERSSPSQMRVISANMSEYVSFNYLNSQAVQILGTFKYRGIGVVISRDEMLFEGENRFIHGCAAEVAPPMADFVLSSRTP